MVFRRSIFECESAPADPILNLSVSFKSDKDSRKVDLGVGAYRDEKGRPYIFQPVRTAREAIATDPLDNCEYFPIDGHAALKSATLCVLIGDSLANEHSSRTVSSQAISGTGALRLAAEYISLHVAGSKIAFISNPTWANHRAIFQRANIAVQEYPYWDSSKKCLDMAGWLVALDAAPAGSTVLLHACAHNPTGCDPTQEQWLHIVERLVSKNLLPLVDCAYQGYASGNLEEDSFLIRELVKRNVEFIVTQSFAKNMGLYGERFGMIHIFTQSSSISECVLSQLKTVIRPMYSSPPIHGAKIALRVLTNPELYSQWLDELRLVSGRVAQMRIALADGLEKATSTSWKHIKDQIGMFSYTGLTPKQVDRMISVWHIYMLKNGRISLAGLNESNIQYVIDAMVDCCNTQLE